MYIIEWIVLEYVGVLRREQIYCYKFFAEPLLTKNGRAAKKASDVNSLTASK